MTAELRGSSENVESGGRMLVVFLDLGEIICAEEFTLIQASISQYIMTDISSEVCQKLPDIVK